MVPSGGSPWSTMPATTYRSQPGPFLYVGYLNCSIRMTFCVSRFNRSAAAASRAYRKSSDLTFPAHHVNLVRLCQRLLRRHLPPLAPGGGKSLLSKIGTGSSHCPGVRATLNRRHGCTNGLAPRLRCTPQSRRPGTYCLPAHHSRQPFAAKGHIPPVTPRARHRYAFLVERLGTRKVPLFSGHLR